MANIFWGRRKIEKMKKIIDLSLDLKDGMITYPSTSHIPFETSIVGRIEIEGRETRKFTMGSHCGTHIDAPKHFIKGSKSVTDFDVNDMIGDALLIDLGVLPPKSIVTLNHIKSQFEKNKNIKRVLFRSNWSRFWGTSQFYNDWPYFEEEVALFLIAKKVKLVGLDFPSPDSQFFGNECSIDSPNHKLFFNAEIILTEYLTNLDKLEKGWVFLIVSPLKLIDFDGAPARVTAYNL